MKMNVKQLGERLAAVERQLNEPQAATCPPSMPMNIASGIDVCAKEAEPRRPSKGERRAKLIAAHVAIEAIRYDVEAWEHRNGLQTAILAAIGSLELRD